jgi:hypothetical protein
MVVVFIWNYRGKNLAWGHASLLVDEGSPAGRVYISWWPSATGREPIIPYAIGPLQNIYRAPAIKGRNYVQDIRDEEQQPDHRIELHGLDETAIKKWWDNFHRGANQWTTLGQNCSTTVAEALQAGGGDSRTQGISGWWSSWNTVWKPSDVLRYALAIQQGLNSR